MMDKTPEWALQQFLRRLQLPLVINMAAFMKAWTLSPGLLAWVMGDVRPILTVPELDNEEMIKQGFLMTYF